MDKFILYKENVNVLDNFIYSVGGFLLNIVLGIITIYCLYDLISLPFTPPENKKSNKKEIFLSITKAIIGLIIVSGLYITTNTKKVKNYEQQFKEQTVQLKDIKELIHVEGDKLTIDPLTNKGKNYYYEKSGLYGLYRNNEKQLFRIDHDDIFEEYKLVDKNNNKIKISKEEYEELKKGHE